MPQIETLPIYLHDGVVFPGCAERLKVHEPISIAMMRNCLSDGSCFGCIPSRPGRLDAPSVYSVGTSVEVLALNEGGFKDIEVTVLGRNRFRVIELTSTGGHRGARTIRVEDTDLPSSKDEVSIMRRDIMQMYERFLLKFPGRFVPMNEELLVGATDEEFSFIVAGHVQLNRDDRIALLEVTSTRERLRRELECMKEMPPIQGRLV